MFHGSIELSCRARTHPAHAVVAGCPWSGFRCANAACAQQSTAGVFAAVPIPHWLSRHGLWVFARDETVKWCRRWCHHFSQHFSPFSVDGTVLVELEIRMGYRKRNDPPEQWRELLPTQKIQRMAECQIDADKVIWRFSENRENLCKSNFLLFILNANSNFSHNFSA